MDNIVNESDYMYYIHLISNQPDNARIRLILLILIDYEITGNQGRQQIHGIHQNALSQALDPNARWLVDSLIDIVRNSERERCIYIFNRIAGLFHNDN